VSLPITIPHSPPNRASPSGGHRYPLPPAPAVSPLIWLLGGVLGGIMA